MNREVYLNDPCGASALPFWKTNSISMPIGMRVVRDDAYLPERYSAYADEPYFKRRIAVNRPVCNVVPRGMSVKEPSPLELSLHIAECYDMERQSETELIRHRNLPVYDPALWVALCDDRGRIVASGLADLDVSIGEGILEWIQVSAEHRNKGYGKWIVTELLNRMAGRALFATVSGRINSPSCPERLYAACGFSQRTIWHVLTKKD